MARRQKTRNRPATVRPVASAVQVPISTATAKPLAGEDSDNGPAVPLPRRPISKGLFLAAAGLGGLWIAVLVVLALVTANPVTLNREQVQTADAVITARVLDAAAGSVIVEKVWKASPQLPLEQLVLANLAESGARTGETYIIPLSRLRGDRFEVTRTRLPNQAPLIYPATEDAVEQLEGVLDRAGGRD